MTTTEIILFAVSAVLAALVILLAVRLTIKRKAVSILSDSIDNFLLNGKSTELSLKDNSFARLQNGVCELENLVNTERNNTLIQNKKNTEFISDVSHQLKTPLTSITVMLDNILDNPDMSKDIRNEFLKDIKKQTTNISFLINSLLKLTKLNADSVTFIDKDEYIENILEEAIKNVGILCELKDTKINISGDKNVKIDCDLKWQVEAITNILSTTD